MNRIFPTNATMSIKPIQIPSAPNKPREYLDLHQVVTWTLKRKRWIQTTEKLITIDILQFLIQYQLRQLLILTDVFQEFSWRLMDQIVGRLDQLFSKDQPTKNFTRGSPTELPFFCFFCKSGISSTTWREQLGFCKRFPHRDFLFLWSMGSGFH